MKFTLFFINCFTMTHIVYIDFERDNKQNIIEIGGILVHNKLVQKEFHCFINRKCFPIYNYYRCAENSHCIPSKIIEYQGIDEGDAILSFKEFIESIPSGYVIIRGHGDDVNQYNLQIVFPFLKTYDGITYEQVPLPIWKDRQFKDYHIATHLMKSVSEILSCSYRNHTVNFMPSWKRDCKTPTHGNLSKFTYGHHCALIDCYELAFYQETLEKYCCDLHFTDDMNYHTDMYILDNGFESDENTNPFCNNNCY